MTKSIKIICDDVVANVSAPSGGTGVIVNAGPNDGIALSGLQIRGGLAATVGVQVMSSGPLLLNNSRIEGFDTSNGTGVLIAPSTSSSTIVMTISNAKILGNLTGIKIANANGGSVGLLVTDSLVAANSSRGINVSSASGSGAVTVSNSILTVDGTAISLNGGTATALLRGSNVQGNGTAVLAASGAVAYTTGTNTILNNQSAGTGLTSVGQQ